MAAPVRVHFAGGDAGRYRVEHMVCVRGEALPVVTRVAVHERTPPPADAAASWLLSGSTGHVRYVEQCEKAALAAVQPALGRPEATRAALIPIRKSDAWWELAQDERRALLEPRSHHIAIAGR
jgi:hypothetical protein